MTLKTKSHRSFDAYQDFLLGSKLYWTRQLYPALKRRYETAAAQATTPVATVEDVAALLRDDTLYQYFGWFERHLQRMKYSGRHGLVPHYSGQRNEILVQLEGVEQETRLTLDPRLEPPAYYAAVDIHQHPGGVWSDEIAGAVYERGARSTTPTLDSHGDLHQRFTAQVLDRAGSAKRLVDMGCGFGKSTRPFYARQEMDVIAVDLAAPCLRLAARIAQEDQARNIRFRQADAAATGLPDASADVVTSTMMLHEMPPRHIERVIAEAHRLLAPGGLSIHLDFLTDEDPFRRFIHYGHSHRNNEPFMPPLNEMDLEGAHRRAGFQSYDVISFEEATGALAEQNVWRFPWVMIVARKAEATANG